MVVRAARGWSAPEPAPYHEKRTRMDEVAARPEEADRERALDGAALSRSKSHARIDARSLVRRHRGAQAWDGIGCGKAGGGWREKAGRRRGCDTGTATFAIQTSLSFRLDAPQRHTTLYPAAFYHTRLPGSMCGELRWEGFCGIEWGRCVTSFSRRARRTQLAERRRTSDIYPMAVPNSLLADFSFGSCPCINEHGRWRSFGFNADESAWDVSREIVFTEGYH